MKIDKKLFIIGMLVLILTMVAATQYAVTKIGYEYAIVNPSESDMRYIGSDNSSDGIRVLRINGDNTTNVSVILRFGNFTTNSNTTYSAAFGIVNEEPYSVNITRINVTSDNITYMKIWLHGNRTANAYTNLTDPSTVFMYSNGSMVNLSANITTAWILAAGDSNSHTMCSNISHRTNNTSLTPWDNTSHVRYSINNTNAVSNVSDYVWVQITIDIPANVDDMNVHGGLIWIYFEAETNT